MAEEIQPALTAEEWAVDGPRIEVRLSNHDVVPGPAYLVLSGDWVPPLQHKTAALCLRDQPFGFKGDDVQGLRKIARDEDWGFAVFEVAGPNPAWLRDLADRIASLLPPEEK